MTQIEIVFNFLDFFDPELEIFLGLFWTGQQAVELGLADGFGSVKTINKLAGTDEQVDYTQGKNPMDNLIRKLGASMGETIAAKLDLGNRLEVRQFLAKPKKPLNF